MIVRSVSQFFSDLFRDNGTRHPSVRLSFGTQASLYSMHDTVLSAGTTLELRDGDPFEVAYCVSGEGQFLDTVNGDVVAVIAGSIYSLEAPDRIILRTGPHALRVIFFEHAVPDVIHSATQKSIYALLSKSC